MKKPHCCGFFGLNIEEEGIKKKHRQFPLTGTVYQLNVTGMCRKIEIIMKKAQAADSRGKRHWSHESETGLNGSAFVFRSFC